MKDTLEKVGAPCVNFLSLAGRQRATPPTDWISQGRIVVNEMLRTGLWPAYSTFGPKIILAHQTELILIAVKLIIKHGVNHSLPT